MTPATPSTEKYQLAGIDDQERGFNRQVEVFCLGSQYQAVLRYERLRVEGDLCESQESALQALINVLHSRGYAQLRTQLIFRGDQYLGSQKPWMDYPDLELHQKSPPGFMGWIKTMWGKW